MPVGNKMDVKKRILFVVESLSGGGAEKVLTTILNNLDYSKFEVGLLSLVDTGVNKDSIPSCVKYYSCLSDSKNNKLWYKIKYYLIYKLLPLRFVYSWLIPDEYDIEIAFIEGFATKLIAKSNKTRKIAWVHIDLALFPWTIKQGIYKNRKEEIDTYKKFETIIAVSETVGTNFKNTYGLDCDVIYNPIDSEDIIRKSKAECELNKTNKVRIISVGRLVYQKCFGRLIRSFKRLIDDGLDVELIILGEGEEKKELQRLISDLNLENKIHLYGFKKNPYSWMKQSDVFVCSSLYEGFSLVIAEAMVLGLPIVSTNCSGPNELLDFGKYGLLVDNSEDALYQGIKKVIIDKDCRKKYSLKSLKRSEDLNIKSSMTEIHNLLLKD